MVYLVSLAPPKFSIHLRLCTRTLFYSAALLYTWDLSFTLRPMPLCCITTQSTWCTTWGAWSHCAAVLHRCHILPRRDTVLYIAMHGRGTLLYIAMHGAHCCTLPCMGHTAVHCHAWGTLLYIAMHGGGTLLYIAMHGAHCCTLPCMWHTAVHCHAGGKVLYSTMHGAHCCTLPCMGHTAVHCHAWGTLLYIAMHAAHCCTLPCMRHTAVHCHAGGTVLYSAMTEVWMTIWESGWNLCVWLVGMISRRRVCLVGGIYGYGYHEQSHL